MSHKLFTYKDIARIVDAMSTEEAEAKPIQVRYVKDIILTQHWPAVIKAFYPEKYTLGDALNELHIREFFNYVWTQQWIMQIFDILDLMGIDEEVLANIKSTIYGMLEQLFAYILKE